jgi:hypothetical protein
MDGFIYVCNDYHDNLNQQDWLISYFGLISFFFFFPGRFPIFIHEHRPITYLSAWLGWICVTTLTQNLAYGVDSQLIPFKTP